MKRSIQVVIDIYEDDTLDLPSLLEAINGSEGVISLGAYAFTCKAYVGGRS